MIWYFNRLFVSTQCTSKPRDIIKEDYSEFWVLSTGNWSSNQMLNAIEEEEWTEHFVLGICSIVLSDLTH